MSKSCVLGIAIAVLFSTAATAITCPSGTWTTLVNGTTADAGPVMTNFNCLAPLISPSFTGPVTMTDNGTGYTLFIQTANTAISTSIRIATPAAAEQASLLLISNLSKGWQFGKNTDDSFFIYDTVAARNDLDIASNGDLSLMPVSGNVGIGPSAPSSPLSVYGGTASVPTAYVHNALSGGGGMANVLRLDNYGAVAGDGPAIEFTIGNYTFSSARIASTIQGASVGDLRFQIGSGTLGSYTEVGRFASDKSFLLGTTTNSGWSGAAKLEAQSATNALSGYTTATTSSYAALLARVDSTLARLAIFSKSGTTVGTITTNGTTTTYGTTSDRRLKNVLEKQTDYRPVIENAWVGDFEWKKTHTHDFGVLAQQLYPLYPGAVWKPQRTADTWQVDYGKLAPLALWGVKDLYKASDKQDEALRSLRKRVVAQSAELDRVRETNGKQARALQRLQQIQTIEASDLQDLKTQLAALRRRASVRTARN